MIDEQQQEQACLYALGALGGDELSAFEARLRDNPELQTLLRELRAVADGIAGTVPALEPPERVRATLLQQLGNQAGPAAVTNLQPRRRPVSAWIPWAMAAGLAMVSFGFIYQAAGLKAQLAAQARRIEELGMSLEVAQAQTGDLRQTVARLRENNRLAAIRIALLDSVVAADPKAAAVSVWDNERQNGVIIVRNLKPAPTGKDYQLWIIDPKYPTPVDAGVFQVDAHGNMRQEFHSSAPIQSVKQFAVTLEKKGGAVVPDLKAMVLAGA